MPKCMGCGAKGLFLKLNSRKLCMRCLSKEVQTLEAQLTPEMKEAVALNKQLEKLNEKLKSAKAELDTTMDKSRELKNKIIQDEEYIELSSSLLKAWLGSCMYDSSKDSDNNIIANIVSALNENAESKTHSRHFCAEDCKKFGLKIKDLEADNAFQDAILSLHHSTMITLEQSSAYKIIDSSNGKSYICTVRDQ